jgi:hypothetical protein
MSHIIKELSSNGFQTSLGWFTCDKFKVLDKAIFKGLKVGDSVDNIKTNKGGFVIAFDIPVANRGGEPVSEAKTAAPHLNSVPPIQVSKMDRQILKGQCLNISFNAMFTGEADICFDANRTRAIKLAQKLFVELEEANYYGW